MKHLKIFCLIGFAFCSLVFVETAFSVQLEIPSKVEVVRVGSSFAIYVDGKHFSVKGAGVDRQSGTDFKSLKDAGATAVRTWRTDQLQLDLDEAHKNGLKVAVGLEVPSRLYNKDFSDREEIEKWERRAKSVVDKYKNHPAVLCWLVGNEINLYFDPNAIVYTDEPIDGPFLFAKRIIDYIHENDPNHPASFTIAGIENKKELLKRIKALIPNADFYSFQTYSQLASIKRHMYENELGDIPYMITEYGVNGVFETHTTIWLNRPIEFTSTYKAKYIEQQIIKGLVAPKDSRLIGHFAFVWGSKQEGTNTWYSLLGAKGELTSLSDSLELFWSGKKPKNLAPDVTHISLDGKIAEQYVILKRNESALVNIHVRDEENDELVIDWELYKDATPVLIREKDESHDHLDESAFEKVTLDIVSVQKGKTAVQFKTPKEPGPYRIYAWVRDSGGKLGYANFPFLVL